MGVSLEENVYTAEEGESEKKEKPLTRNEGRKEEGVEKRRREKEGRFMMEGEADF